MRKKTPNVFKVDKLAFRMAELNYSQSQLARRMGIHRSQISRWLTGECRPELIHLVGLCDVLGVAPGYLLQPLPLP